MNRSGINNSINGIRKFLRYYHQKNKVKLMEAMEYRADFFMITLSSYGYNLAALLFLNVVFANIDSIAGWTKFEIFFFYGTAELVGYIYWSFFSNVDKTFPKLIQKGDLDMYLMKPVNSLLNIITYNIALVETLPSTILAIGIIVYAWINLEISVGFNLAVYIILILTSALINLAVRTLVSITTFWLTDSEEIRRFYTALSDNTTYVPMEVYPIRLRNFLTTVVPVALIAYVPTYFLIRGFSWPLILNFFLVLFLFWVFVVILWKKGLKAYSSASS